MNRLCLAPLTVGDPPSLDHVDAAAAGGFDAVELRIVGAPGAKLVPRLADRPDLRRALSRRLSDAGVMAFAAAGLWLLPDTKVAAFLPDIEAAHALGARHLLAAGNDPDPSRLADNFAALCAAAAPFDLRIGIEFMPYTEVRTIEEAARLVRAGGGNAGIILDVLHLRRSGGSPASVAAVGRDLISYVQLCDAPLEKPPEIDLRTEALRHRRDPGGGELWLFDLMDALPPDVTIDVETPSAAYAALAPMERAAIAGEATRRFLAAYKEARQRAPR